MEVDEKADRVMESDEDDEEEEEEEEEEELATDDDAAAAPPDDDDDDDEADEEEEEEDRADPPINPRLPATSAQCTIVTAHFNSRPFSSSTIADRTVVYWPVGYSVYSVYSVV